MEQVAALLGHSHIETTRTHYAEPSKKQMQESMKKGTEREPDKKEWLGNTDEIKRKFGLLYHDYPHIFRRLSLKMVYLLKMRG